MKEHKKSARPDVGASERAKGTEPTFQSGPHSYPQSTTSLPLGQDAHIAKLLSVGAGHAIPLHDLVALTGWSEREVRRQIERERRRGVPILSDNMSGYFLPANENELAQFIKSMRHRAGEILKSAAAIEQGASE